MKTFRRRQWPFLLHFQRDVAAIVSEVNDYFSIVGDTGITFPSRDAYLTWVSQVGADFNRAWVGGLRESGVPYDKAVREFAHAAIAQEEARCRTTSPTSSS